MGWMNLGGCIVSGLVLATCLSRIALADPPTSLPLAEPGSVPPAFFGGGVGPFGGPAWFARNAAESDRAEVPLELEEEPAVTVPVYDPDDEGVPEPEHWSSFLPIFGRTLREKGFDLPYPFGISLNYIHVDRDIEVKKIRVAVDGGPDVGLDRFLQIGANSSVDVVIGRLDVWLLPFLNVYGYGGRQYNESDARIDVSIPPVVPFPPASVRVRGSGKLEGPVYGGGFQVAGGYDWWFLTGGADFAFAEFDEFDSDFSGRVYGVRTGWQGAFRRIGLRAWTGASYFDTRTTVKGRFVLPDSRVVRFKVDQRPQHPWNAVIGFNASPSKHFDLTFEYGFNFDDVHIYTLIGTARF